MDDFIKMATSQLGISEPATRSATGGILEMLKGKLGDGTFAQLSEKLPGADALVRESADAGGAAAKEAGGMFGGLVGKASAMLGAGGAADILSSLSAAGLNPSQSGSFVKMFVEFVKGKVGDDLWGKIAKVMPGVE